MSRVLKSNFVLFMLAVALTELVAPRSAVDTGGPARVTASLSSFQQNSVEFHSAGTLAEEVSFRFDNGFADDTGVLTTGMAFVQFDPGWMVPVVSAKVPVR